MCVLEVGPGFLDLSIETVPFGRRGGGGRGVEKKKSANVQM